MACIEVKCPSKHQNSHISLPRNQKEPCQLFFVWLLLFSGETRYGNCVWIKYSSPSAILLLSYYVQHPATPQQLSSLLIHTPRPPQGYQTEDHRYHMLHFLIFSITRQRNFLLLLLPPTHQPSTYLPITFYSFGVVCSSSRVVPF